VKHCWTAVYGDCSGSGGDGPPIHPGGGGGASWDGGYGGGGSSSTVPEPDDLEGAECIPDPVSSSIDQLQALWSGAKDKLSKAYNYVKDTFQTVGCRVDTLRGQFLDQADDLSVKVPGGEITVSRWFVRNNWHFEHTRHSLSFQYSGDELKTIRKGAVLFERKESGETTYIGNDARIEQTPEGYRWEDKTGRWKHFDQKGRLMAYGDRDGVTGKLIYDSENATLPEGIADRTGEQVVWYEHSGGKIFAVRDSSGRRVEYTYSQDKLSEITGVLGKETTYEYDNQGRIISKTDAAGRKIQEPVVVPLVL
jgi:YD repeat-containing protein